MIRIASFDIGYRNLCFSVEEYYTSHLESLKKLSKLKQYNPDGTMTPEQSSLIKSICLHSKTVTFVNTDLTKETLKVLTPDVFHTLTDLLDSYKDLWDTCSIFLIEKQMSFKGVYNISALKLGQHCWSYFAFNYGRFKQILDFPAFYKTQIMGAPKIQKHTKKGKISYKSMEKPQRKKWAIEKAFAVMAERDDFQNMGKFQSEKKKDDVADCILQSVSAAYLIFVEKSI